MKRKLSREVAALVKMTAPAFRIYGEQIAISTYRRLLADPVASTMFDTRALLGNERARQLAEALFAFADNIDKPDGAADIFACMAERHVEDGITPEHYPYIADALLSAIRDVLGEGASDFVLDAWGEAFWYLADILIAREAALYRAARLMAANEAA